LSDLLEKKWPTMDSALKKNDFSDPKQHEIESPVSPPSYTSDKQEQDGNADLTWTDDEEKKIRRKLDFRLVPIVTVLYLLCFLDRANIGKRNILLSRMIERLANDFTGNARIQGMQEELDLSGYRFNWALTIFYFTYIAFVCSIRGIPFQS
jgi:hypothetical protein